MILTYVQWNVAIFAAEKQNVVCIAKGSKNKVWFTNNIGKIEMIDEKN